MPLWIVATPIGNLSDITARASEALAGCDAVVAEDTRHTRGLLDHLRIEKPLLSLPAFDEKARLPPLVERLKAGQTLALVTDAGTPGVSDPGQALVDAAWEAGVPVCPYPGPSAAVTALSASGFESTRFLFCGFLPRTGEDRRRAIEEFLSQRATLILYEAGNRTGQTLADLAERLGPRRALVARELTKRHEELRRGPLDTLADAYRDGALGEVTIVIEGAREADIDARQREEGLPPIDAAIAVGLRAGDPVRDLSRALAEAYRLPRQQVYALILQKKAEQ